MFILKIHQPGIEVQRIKHGQRDRRVLPGVLRRRGRPGRRRGRRDQRRLDGGVPPALPRAGRGGRRLALRRVALAAGDAGQGGPAHPTWPIWPGTPARPTIPVVRQLVAEARVNDRVQQQLTERVTTGIRTGALPGPAGALPRLFAATNTERHFDIGLEIAGPAAGAWARATRPAGGATSTCPVRATAWAAGATRCSATSSASGCWACPGSIAADRDQPFDEVRHNRSPQQRR